MTAGMDLQGLANVARFLRGRLLLGRLAVLNGYIREDELRACLREQRERPGRPPLATLMVECGMLSEEQVAELLRQQKHLEDLDVAGRVVPAVAGADRLIGRYAVLEEVASGPSGVTWKAWDTQLQRHVTLKEVRLEAWFPRGLFLGEARSAVRLRHPNLVEVYETFQEEGRDYLVMNWVEGKPLDRVSLPVPRVVSLMAEVADAVHALHREGVLHGDIRPESIRVDAQGRGYLGEFGPTGDLARRVRIAEGRYPGESGFAAPEQLSGEAGLVGPATDVYGLGATLYCAVTERPPGGAPVPPSHVSPAVPKELDAVILRAMAKVPSDRHANAALLGEDLRRCQFKRARKNPLPAFAAGAAALAVAAGVLVAMHQGAARGPAAEYRAAYGKGIEEWGRARGADIPAAGEALRRFEEAAASEPSAAAPRVMQGRCLLVLGRGPEAERAWTDALARDPGCGPALMERGKYYWTESLRRRPPPSLWAGREEDGEARRLRATGAADLERARRARGLDPAEAKCLEGMIAFEEGRYGEAAAALDGYARANPWDTAGLAFLSAARALAGEGAGAEEALRRALRRDPADPDLLFDLAGILRARGDVPRAAVELRKAVERAPSGWPRRAMAERLLREWSSS